MTLRKTLSIMLAALLLVVTGFIGFMTVQRYYRDMGYAFLVTYNRQLSDSPTVQEQLRARINAVTSSVNTNMVMKHTLQRLNARIQMAMGKQMLSYGGSTMVTTATGHLYDLMPDTDATRGVRAQTLNGLRQLNDKLSEKGIPLLYGYAHTTLYDGESLPDGVTDDNNAVADEIVASLESYGIRVIDSREIMRESGLPLNEIIYRTDAHWSVRSAFEMYTHMVDLLNADTSIKADRNAADIENFDVSYLPKAHISDIGNRLGADVIAPDDFEIITPKFDTNIRREIMKDKVLVPSDGRFEDVVLEKSMLPEAQGLEYGNCYNYYGQHPDVVYYTNEAAPEGRLLIIKDSFGTPTSSFMAMAVRDVCAIDLRKTQKTVEDYVESFKPDVVMFVQCQEVMRGQNFVFVDQK